MEEMFWNYTPEESGRRHGLGGGKDDDDEPMLLPPDGNGNSTTNSNAINIGPVGGSSAPANLGTSGAAPAGSASFVTVEVLLSTAAGISAHGMRSRRHTSASSALSGITNPGDVGNDADESDTEVRNFGARKRSRRSTSLPSRSRQH
jgi:hypothetical protein